MPDYLHLLYWRMIDAYQRLARSGRPWAGKAMIQRWARWAYVNHNYGTYDLA